MKTFNEVIAEQDKKCEGCQFSKHGDCSSGSEWHFYRDRDSLTNQSYPNGIDLSKRLPCYRPKQRETIRAGQIVTIYEDPITCTKPEGKAELVTKEDTYNDGLESWLVRFLDEPTEIRSRLIKATEGGE